MCKYDNNLFIVFSVQPKAQDKYDSVLMLVPLKNTADTNTLLITELTLSSLIHTTFTPSSLLFEQRVFSE